MGCWLFVIRFWLHYKHRYIIHIIIAQMYISYFTGNIMIVTRQQLEENEARTLAPYALLSKNSRGRRHHDHEPKNRTAFQRDRDRIVHSAAFRRLEYKTQVFVNDEGDYY